MWAVATLHLCWLRELFILLTMCAFTKIQLNSCFSAIMFQQDVAVCTGMLKTFLWSSLELWLVPSSNDLMISWNIGEKHVSFLFFGQTLHSFFYTDYSDIFTFDSNRHLFKNVQNFKISKLSKASNGKCMLK